MKQIILNEKESSTGIRHTVLGYYLHQMPVAGHCRWHQRRRDPHFAAEDAAPETRGYPTAPKLEMEADQKPNSAAAAAAAAPEPLDYQPSVTAVKQKHKPVVRNRACRNTTQRVLGYTYTKGRWLAVAANTEDTPILLRLLLPLSPVVANRLR